MRTRKSIEADAEGKNGLGLNNLILEVLLDIRDKTQPPVVNAPYVENQTIIEKVPKRGRPKKVNISDETTDSNS